MRHDRKPLPYTFGVEWDIRFLELAKSVGQWSKDRSTKVGCVIVGPDREIRSTGYNGFPRGVYDTIDCRHARPAKYAWTEHAERNAIYNAARMGTALLNCTLYYHWPASGPPCADCARAIIQSGVSRVVGKIGDDEPIQWRPDWRESQLVSVEMFKEAYVLFHTVNG